VILSRWGFICVHFVFLLGFCPAGALFVVILFLYYDFAPLGLYLWSFCFCIMISPRWGFICDPFVFVL